MAITITRQPGNIRYSKDPFVFVCTSDKTDEKEFAYVIDIEVTGGSSILDEHIIKQANPTGALIVDLSRIIDDNLTPDFGPLAATTDTNTSAVNGTKHFTVKFGEQYQNNAGELTKYTGAATETEGDPAIASTSKSVLKGQSENAWDLDTDDSLSFTDGDQLTHIFRNEWYTDQYIAITYWDGSERRPKYFTGQRTTPGATSFQFTNDGNELIAGFNVIDDTLNDLGNTHFTFWHNGAWDCFTATEEASEQVSLSRDTSESSPIAWGGTDGSLREGDNDNVYRKGTNNYRNTREQTITKNTQWLTSSEWDRVNSMLHSRWVYVQEGTVLVPIEITNSSYQVKHTVREERLHQYSITYRYSTEKPNV